MKTLDKYKPFEYQALTAKLGIQKISETGGLMIMDSTGLGKTITSLTIALNLPKTKKVLVVAPNKNKIGWTNTIKQQTDLKVTLCGGHKLPTDTDFDLFIIDEAHNYRNTSAASYKNIWCAIRSQNKIPNVILLSATPYQNTFEEFQNTIALIPFKANTYAFLHLGNVINNIKINTKIINNVKRYKGDDISFQDINKLVESDMANNKLIEQVKKHLGEFCIRNTREYIATMYPNDMNAIGMFPTIVKHDKTDYKASEPFHTLVSSVHKMIGNDSLLPFAKYNLQKYSKQNENYIGMNGIMRSFLLKRLDSSLIAFKESVIKMIDSIQMILAQYDSKNEFSNISIDDTEYSLGNEFFNDCQKDVLTLTELLNKANACPLHDKETALLNIINRAKGKTVVFTEYKATLNTICSFLKQHNISYISVDGNSDDKVLDVVSNEFDANLPKKEQTNKYDVLIATDVLAEGTNLHRAENLIHYDSKWNPQKTIQRNGRVDRIYAEPVNNHIINIHTFAIDSFIDSIIKFENKTSSKLEISEQLLDFNWLDYKPNIDLKYEIGKKYYVEKTNENARTLHYGFKLNSGYNLILKEDHIAELMHGDSKYECLNYDDVNRYNILSEGVYGNGSNIGGKVEYHTHQVYGYRGRYVYKDVFQRFLGMENHLDLLAIFNSYLNKDMLEIIAKEVLLKKEKTEFLNMYRTIITNIISTQGHSNIKYYQVVPDGIWMQD